MTLPPTVLEIWLLSLTFVAALFDARSGLIPNWLTLPSLAFALLAHTLAGPGALGLSLASALVCAAVPCVLFVRGAMGGGDVKLFAAAGALAGWRDGLELQLATYVIAGVWAIGRLTARGELLAFARRAGRMLVPGSGARGGAATAEASAMASVRLGVPAFVACAALIGSRLWVP